MFETAWLQEQIISAVMDLSRIAAALERIVEVLNDEAEAGTE